MTTKKKTTGSKVEIVENTDEQVNKPTPDGTIVDGIYTERNVELTNGIAIDVEVIVDRMKLPATFGKLMSEGNTPAIIIAQLTAKTRTMLDMFGATLEDVTDVLPPVIQRASEMKKG